MIPENIHQTLVAEGFNEIHERTSYEKNGYRLIWVDEIGALLIPSTVPAYLVSEVIQQFPNHIEFVHIHILPDGTVMMSDPGEVDFEVFSTIINQLFADPVITTDDNTGVIWAGGTVHDTKIHLAYFENTGKVLIVVPKISAETYYMLTRLFPESTIVSDEMIFNRKNRMIH